MLEAGIKGRDVYKRQDERYWLMMLDSCQYDPENKIGGRIRKETLLWMEKWLERAREEQVMVIPVAHHNLLKESTLYPEDCTLENAVQVIDLLEQYGLPVYISGHLHLQRAVSYTHLMRRPWHISRVSMASGKRWPTVSACSASTTLRPSR